MILVPVLIPFYDALWITTSSILPLLLVDLLFSLIRTNNWHLLWSSQTEQWESRSALWNVHDQHLHHHCHPPGLLISISIVILLINITLVLLLMIIVILLASWSTSASEWDILVLPHAADGSTNNEPGHAELCLHSLGKREPEALEKTWDNPWT